MARTASKPEREAGVATEVHGHTAAGFEQVAEVLSQAQLDDGGGAFCAIVDGEVVVDLWRGQATADRDWQQDTVACLYSATKGLTTSCLVDLHAQGRLDLDAPVAAYWPAFAAAGKETVTVRQLLSHSAGLPAVPGYAEFLGVHGEGWDDVREIRRRLADAAPVWPPGQVHGYHGLTYGYLAGALVEQINGKPMPSYFREQLAGPRGLELWFGLPDDVHGRRADQLAPAPLPPALAAAVEPLLSAGRDPDTLLGQVFLAQHGTGVLDHLAAAGYQPATMNCGAGNGDAVGTARGLAQLYAHLSAEPTRDSLAAFGVVQRRDVDRVLGTPASWCVGFQGNQPTPAGDLAMGPGAGAFGHHGAGGQLGGADLDRDITFGFVRNQLSSVTSAARDLVSAVYVAHDRSGRTTR